MAMVLTTLLLAGWTADSVAVSHATIPQRIAYQHRRINEGINTGHLTRREADIVLDNLEWIEATAHRMTRDGVFTKREQEKMVVMLDRNSRMISKEVRDFENVYWGNFQERIHEQQQRIKEGVANARLTRHEFDIVQGNLDWIKATFARMKQDGRLKAKETRRLDEMLDQNSKLIYKNKHDLDYFFFKDRYRDFR
jgi:hypothetical protein